MGNKIWIFLLSMCALVFAAFACFSIWLGFKEKMFWQSLLGFLWMSFLTERAGKLAVSRIRYGPKGPPPDPLENFHVDF
jgi:hypothetical protein